MPKKMDSATDHDILITLVETVKNNHVSISEKMDNLRTNIKDLSTESVSNMKDHELRLEKIESLLTTYEPKPLVSMLMAHDRWINEFNFTWKLMIGLAAGIGGIVGFLVSVASGLINIFGKGV